MDTSAAPTDRVVTRAAAWIEAAAWPIDLLLSIEVLSWVRWLQRGHWAFVRHRYRTCTIGVTDAETAELYDPVEAVTW